MNLKFFFKNNKHPSNSSLIWHNNWPFKEDFQQVSRSVASHFVHSPRSNTSPTHLIDYVGNISIDINPNDANVADVVIWDLDGISSHFRGQDNSQWN